MSARDSTSFVGIDGNDLSGTFSVLFRNCEFVRISMADSIGIPDAPFFPEITFFNSMFETFDRSYVRIIRLRRVEHIEGVKLVPFVRVAEMLDSLCITREPLFFALNSHSSRRITARPCSRAVSQAPKITIWRSWLMKDQLHFQFLQLAP